MIIKIDSVKSGLKEDVLSTIKKAKKNLIDARKDLSDIIEYIDSIEGLDAYIKSDRYFELAELDMAIRMHIYEGMKSFKSKEITNIKGKIKKEAYYKKVENALRNGVLALYPIANHKALKSMLKISEAFSM